ncbi:restriction endonuclease [Pseudomonas sp. BIGb0427]|uniref:restriction endonuclease n=1 Tax=Pseudomonas sp. BIGb0427 TaxID=2724470 RepID=UPI0018A6DAA6|nr:restriction endonuclease [Pseudomonas sp. BIGb0427]QPG63839.1 restriction endonuclease [Pseudomonas sp. BIGb0427]
MPKIKPLDMKLLDLLFEMEGGYVLDFSNATFSRFFLGELEIDIDDPLFTADGTSKAKRFRSFLTLADTQTCVRALKAVWAHRQGLLLHQGRDEPVANAEGRFLTLIQELESGTSSSGVAGDPFVAVRKVSIDQAALLKQKLLEIHKLGAQARGYAFEAFLQQLFEVSNLQPRAPFRNTGEQIDGSFLCRGDIYLIEAKWVKEAVGVRDLHNLQGKISEKAAWTRGVFISYYGFTDVGLNAFGRGKSLVCISGKDIHDALDRQIPFSDIIDRKVRAAAETGSVFVEVSKLF